MPRTQRIAFLEDVGTTVHCDHPHRNGPVAASRVHRITKRRALSSLVVGHQLTSHFWLNILPLCHDANLRYYITEDDLELLDDHLHVRPTIVPSRLLPRPRPAPACSPSFLVFIGGYPVDWFPASLAASGEAVDPTELIEGVRRTLTRYGVTD